MDILNNLDKNTKILNISNCGLKGVLDLEDFKNLEELDCSKNEITEIINIPKNIKCVDCSFNKLEELRLYYWTYRKLEELYCNYNEITTLVIPEIKKVNSANNKISELESQIKDLSFENTRSIVNL